MMTMMPQAAPQQNQMNQPFVANGREVTLKSGLQEWVNKAPVNSTYTITGSDYSQLLEVDVHPGEVVTCEPGTMTYMSPELQPDIDMGGCGQGCKRCCCAGESMFRLHFKNETEESQQLGLTPKYPAKVVPIDLAKYDGLIFNKGAFLAALGSDWKVQLKRLRSVGAMCCAGQGLFMSTLHGSGMVFLNAGGTVMTKTLDEDEELVVSQDAVLAFEKSVEIDIRQTGGCFMCCCGGMGLFNAVLTGPGLVMLHTMSMQKMAKLVPSGGGGGGGGGGGDGGS